MMLFRMYTRMSSNNVSCSYKNAVWNEIYASGNGETKNKSFDARQYGFKSYFVHWIVLFNVTYKATASNTMFWIIIKAITRVGTSI